MLSYEQIIDYCSKYKIENGKVINKHTNQEVLDENTILIVKAAILLYRDANETYQTDITQFGSTKKRQQDYIQKTMEKFGVNNEENNYGINKLINAILSSNGHYEENMSGNDLKNSKFSILIQPKYEYTMCYLKLKFRERGLDIEDLKVSQDLSQLEKNGISRVIIDYKIKKYEKEKPETIKTPAKQLYQHPRAEDLNGLEKQKQLAKENNDEVGYNYAQANIKRIISENRAEVSPQQWDEMSIDTKISFIKVKMNEARVLNDEDDFNYWKANLDRLEDEKRNLAKEETRTEPIASPIPKDYKYYYNEMLKSLNEYNPNHHYTEEDKKRIVGEIFYNQMYIIDSLKTEEECRDLMTLLVNELTGNELKLRLQNITLSELQEKYDMIKNKNSTKVENSTEDKQQDDKNDLDLSQIVRELKNELERIQKSYRLMLSDGYIDDTELATLLNMINTVLANSYTAKSVTTNMKDEKALSIIIDSLEKERKKMQRMQNGIEEIGRGYSK